MVDLTRQALASRLKEQIESRYLIYGKESFLSERCVDMIRGSARQAGFEERIALIAERDFDWSVVAQHLSSMSLFSKKKIVEMRLLTDRPGTAAGEVLAQCMQVIDSDTIMVLVLGAVDSAMKRSKWFKSWQEGAICVDNRPLNPRQFRDWIKSALDRRKILYERDVVDRLAYLFEGNMLAAANEMRKIAMGYDGERLTCEQIDLVVSDQGQFTVYALADACVAGSASRALRLLQALRNEGEEPILILWAFAREVRAISTCADMVASGDNVRRAMNSMGVWKSKQALMEKAVRRIGARGSEAILSRIAHADRVIKGQDAPSHGDAWSELERTALMMCGVRQLDA